MYYKGEGVEQDTVEAATWYRKSAEAGYAVAQFNLGFMYCRGEGVEQDTVEAAKWAQWAAAQGNVAALRYLDLWQQSNSIPTPPPATAVTTILLTSAKAAMLNHKTGTVVEPAFPTMARPGIAFVLIDGEAKPRLFKAINLRSRPSKEKQSHRIYRHICTT